MKMMKKLLLNDWRGKLGSILVAFAIWYLVKASFTPQLEWRPYVPPANLEEEVFHGPE